VTSKQLNKLYEKNKVEYLDEIRNDDNSYTCQGCGNDFMFIEIHHILKRRFKYFFADKRNFIHLCNICHRRAESTIDEQKSLNCYDEMEATREALLQEYNSLEPYEKSLLFKYN